MVKDPYSGFPDPLSPGGESEKEPKEEQGETQRKLGWSAFLQNQEEQRKKSIKQEASGEEQTSPTQSQSQIEQQKPDYQKTDWEKTLEEKGEPQFKEPLYMQEENGEKRKAYGLIGLFSAILIILVALSLYNINRLPKPPLPPTSPGGTNNEKPGETPGTTTPPRQERPGSELEEHLIVEYLIEHAGAEIFTETGLELSIPAGAVNEPTLIQIEKIADGRVTDLYHLKPDGLKFLRPITVSIPYKPSGLASNETAEDINLQYWFRPNGPRQNLNYGIDEENRRLITLVSEF